MIYLQDPWRRSSKKAQKEMLDVMNDAEMSEEEKFDKYADILGSMTDDAWHSRTG